MAGVIRRPPWRQQPQRSIPMDQGNPLARGLFASIEGHAKRDGLTGDEWSTANGEPARVITQRGQAWDTSGGILDLRRLVDGPLSVSAPWTFATTLSSTANVSLSHAFGFGHSFLGTVFYGVDHGGQPRSLLNFNNNYYFWGSAADWDTGIPWDTDGLFHTVMFSCDGTNISFYRDGVFRVSSAKPAALVDTPAGCYAVLGNMHHDGTASPTAKILSGRAWSRALSAAEASAYAANEWQVYASPHRRAQRTTGAVVTWIGPDGSGTGWLSTASTRWEAIDETGAADDADYITSPYLTSTAVPAVESLTTPLVAGNYTFSVRARLTDALGSATLRVRFLSALNADVGVTAGQALTSTFATYSMTVTLSGTATQMQLEVVSP